jgi:hypothetical protein
VVVTPGRSAIPFERAATVAPERGARRSSGATLVEASVTARLLGMKILTLDAKVALVPAEVMVAAPRVREPAARSSALSSGNARGRAASVGHRGLADAVRTLDEGARLLAEVQRRSGL